METKTPWEKSFDLTLEEQVNSLAAALDDAQVSLSVGAMWMQRRSDVSYSASQALVRLASSHKQAMGALSQLQYWMGSNGYAITLTTRQLSTNWCGGSVMLMALIEQVFLVVFYEDMFFAAVPDVVSDVWREHQP